MRESPSDSATAAPPSSVCDSCTHPTVVSPPVRLISAHPKQCRFIDSPFRWKRRTLSHRVRFEGVKVAAKSTLSDFDRSLRGGLAPGFCRRSRADDPLRIMSCDALL